MVYPANRYSNICIEPAVFRRLPELANKITFANTRKCTDGICCFWGKESSKVSIGTDNRTILLACGPPLSEMAKIPGRAAQMQHEEYAQVLAEMPSIDVDVYVACKNINILPAVDRSLGQMSLSVSCNNYSRRPPICKIHPSEQDGICTFLNYLFGPSGYEKESIGAILLLGLEVNTYPQVAPFALTTIYDNVDKGYTYYLLPVPWDPGYQHLAPILSL